VRLLEDNSSADKVGSFVVNAFCQQSITCSAPSNRQRQAIININRQAVSQSVSQQLLNVQLVVCEALMAEMEMAR